jgi:hypothetical protein
MNAKSKTRRPEKWSKRTPLLLTAGAAAVLIGGGSIAYWYFNRQEQLSVMPAGSNVIPQDALMVVSVTTNLEQWQKLREFGTPRSQASFDKNLAQWRDQFLAKQQLDYQRDVQPWVGKEVTMAFLSPQTGVMVPPPTQLGIPPERQPMVMVLPIADPLKAKEVLEKSPATKSSKWTERDYKGIKVRENQEKPGQVTSIAVIDTQQVVVANAPKAIEKAIDTLKGGAALSTTPGYGEALTQIKSENPVARVYMNVAATAGNAAANSNRQLPPQTLSQIQQNQGIAATATIANEGIQLNAISWLKPNSQSKFNTSNNAKIMPNRLPSETLVMASGGNFKQFWQDYSRDFSAGQIQIINPEVFRRGLQSTVGLDLDKDLLSWMQGEFSLALLPAPQGSPAGLPFSLVFMAQTNDRRTADTALKKLDEAMASRDVKIEESSVAGQPVVNWVLPNANVNITRGWMDGNVAFLSIGAPVTKSLLPNPTGALVENELFQRTTKSELAQNNGHFFIDVDRVLSLQNFPLPNLPEVNRTTLEAIRSIGVTSAITSDRTARYDVFVMLKKGEKPKEFPASKPSP